MQGPQGCGKTTLCNELRRQLGVDGIHAEVLSLDDLYLDFDGLEDMRKRHPDNPLLSGRGQPGTHDLGLISETLGAVLQINTTRVPVHLPMFDKSANGGRGDRSGETTTIQAPVDVFVLEGWSFGFMPLTPDGLKERHGGSSAAYSSRHSLDALLQVNTNLSTFAATTYAFPFATLVQIEPVDYDLVFRWRLEQEQAMKAANGGRGMTDAEVEQFVARYMPGYELWKDGMWETGRGLPWEGSGLRLYYGPEREVTAVVRM
ncbi:hypothetical protein VHUM_02028 [Vanrija humicola]|uniref:Phosphoribulokinase/uridine kinase domain-containing protein n=1 Tax=Vanrija humicola TaxID=5417 RepID=A0A7D8Z208_VANHU|nr:hypothetical protein VHUM_02028 [Vanrija humicola]